MHEISDGYVFTTFQDGDVIFFNDSYERHCGYHECIRGQEGRDKIQNALIQPHRISKYFKKDAKSGEIIAECKKYYCILDKTTTHRGEEFLYWEIVLVQKIGQRKKIVAAYIESAPKYAMINDRIEEIIYNRNYEQK